MPKLVNGLVSETRLCGFESRCGYTKFRIEAMSDYDHS